MKTKISRREFGRTAAGALAAGAAGLAISAQTGCRTMPIFKPARRRKPFEPQPRTLKVALRGADGQPLPEGARNTLYVADLHFEPERRALEIKSDGTVEIAATIPNAALHAKIPVADFGDVWVRANNGGEGYGAPAAPLDFVREAAFSRLSEVQRLMKSSGAKFSAECRAHREASIVFLNFGEGATGEKAAQYNMAALSHALWAGELAVGEHARDVSRHRGRRRGFLFGCNAFRYQGDTPYADHFQQVMNYATLPFYLRSLEPEKGQPQYERIDRILEWCKRVGIRPKGHPLWWGHEAGIPKWLEGASWTDARRECERVVGRSVTRYRGRIDMWDVINEAHDWANGLKLTQEQEVEITRVCCDTARSKNSHATIVVNNCCPFGDYAATGRVHLGPVYDKVLTPLAYLDRLAEAGVEYDVVGVQIYFPNTDMMTIDQLLDEYAKFGKPVHITELGVRTEGGRRDGAGDWHRPWSESVQADWMEWFYTIAYARPEIEAITWWDFADPAFIPTSGFLREDNTPREMFFRLKALQESWGHKIS